ncbi:PHB depolymerase family esterase [Sphingomonas sp. ST-64]|uniref:PHB depolymerase family esterase n=1 Tax=Sphingomonas plantiphila TaxID=3163295 RepID=A0ABW8YS24_9SPHN
MRALRTVAVALLLCMPQAAFAQTERAAAAPAGQIALPEDAIAYIPPRAIGAAPLLVLLHGATERPQSMVARFRAEADRRGIVLLAPKSAGDTWDMIADFDRRRSQVVRSRSARLNVDPPRINRAIRALLERASVDPARIALGGFSDGASYALTIGSDNPGFFRTLLVFSPGMLYLSPRRSPGQRVFLSHGSSDPVLSFQASKSRFVPQLRKEGLAVTFREFDGRHELPDIVLQEAVAMWLDMPSESAQSSASEARQK